MSKYTIELRYICETLAGLSESKGYDDVDTIIANSRTRLFSFNYPIFDEEYRPILEEKIIRHFYTREIGVEAVGLFKLKLEAKMCEIMPYYNKLYLSELLEIDPLTDVNYTRSGSESLSASESTLSSLSTSESESMSSSTQGSEWDLYQDTPQNGLSGVTDYSYLTNADNRKNNNTGQSASQNIIASQGRGTRDATQDKGYLEKFTGYRNNNPSKLLTDYRETFLNIDMAIIKDLEELFMLLW